MSHFDRQAARAALRLDWRNVPPNQRVEQLLNELEKTIVDDRPNLRNDLRSAFSPTLHVIYVVMAAWCISGAIFRLIIQTNLGQPIDLLPFISIAIGGIATWRYLRAPIGPRRTGSNE